MADGLDAHAFRSATVLGRAVLLLQRAFREPDEPVNVAQALANDASSAGAFVGGVGIGGRDRSVLHLVSEAWQLLVSARMLCPDLEQSTGTWWRLTGVGRQARNSSDPEGEILLRLGGAV